MQHTLNNSKVLKQSVHILTLPLTVLTVVFSLQGEFPNYCGGHHQIMSENAMPV